MKKNETLSIPNEELLSSLDIQDWNLKTFAQEIYDNIGQMLSLTKIRIATLNPDKKEETKKIVEQSDLLLSKAIKDLRNLARQLTPTEIMNKGFADSVCQELERMNRACVCETEYNVKGEPYQLEGIRELILFSILHHYIYKALYKEKTGKIKLNISYTKKNIHLKINWLAELDKEFTGTETKESKSVFKRIRLINANIVIGGNEREKKIHLLVKRNSS
jgi:signal transduction histidine kinase